MNNSNQQNIIKNNKISKYLTFYIIALLCFFELSITPSHAETYRWTDSNGKIFVGNNPPPGAKNVQPIESKSYSKYSSDKVIDAYKGYKTSKSPTDDSVKAKGLDIIKKATDGVSEQLEDLTGAPNENSKKGKSARGESSISDKADQLKDIAEDIGGEVPTMDAIKNAEEFKKILQGE